MNDFPGNTLNEPQHDAGEAVVDLPNPAVETLSLDETHLAFFRDCYPTPRLLPSGNDEEGKAVKKWYDGGPAEKPAVNLDRYDRRLNRSSLIALQADGSVSTLELCIAILAWGGMRGSNRNHLFKRPTEPWLDVSQAIRDGKMSRQAAFDAYAELSRDGKLVGMGPAYYTKLIYFLMPRESAHPVGYIMDQWLGCSINLISAQDVVRMDAALHWVEQEDGAVQSPTFSVSPLNTGEQYERFCQVVELVASNMGANWSPDAAELAMMSSGGHSSAPWRAHVVEHRRLSLAG